MSEQKQDGPIREFVSGALCLTMLGGVLYFLGMVYWTALIETLGLDSGLFRIPVYEVIFESWAQVAYLAVMILLFGIIFVMRGLLVGGVVLILCFVFNLLFGWIPSRTFFEKVARRGKPVIEFVKRRIPKKIRRGVRVEMESLDENEFFVFAVCGIFLLMVLVAGMNSAERGENWASRYLQNRNGPLVVIELAGKETLTGKFVRAIGDQVIIDLTAAKASQNENVSTRLVVISRKECRRIEFLQVQALAAATSDRCGNDSGRSLLVKPEG